VSRVPFVALAHVEQARPGGEQLADLGDGNLRQTRHGRCKEAFCQYFSRSA
jgi:hypothetical protein